jgi:aspartyl aminopeptidase
MVMLCDKYNIPYKKFVNHSDVVGGGTMGPIISSWLPMKTVDIGIPMLAMHSARELMGIKDQKALVDLATAFFTE